MSAGISLRLRLLLLPLSLPLPLSQPLPLHLAVCFPGERDAQLAGDHQNSRSQATSASSTAIVSLPAASAPLSLFALNSEFGFWCWCSIQYFGASSCRSVVLLIVAASALSQIGRQHLKKNHWKIEYTKTFEMPHKLQLVLGAAGGVSRGAYQICNCSPTPRAAPLALFSNAPDPRSTPLLNNTQSKWRPHWSEQRLCNTLALDCGQLTEFEYHYWECLKVSFLNNKAKR